ncbi:MAG TPA: hypothetical protein VF659_18330 [Pyrinomonadaceae bacterium]|jgi:hypothetical protein
MRKRICLSTLALSLLISLATVSPAYAKSVDGARAHVPFDFYVGERLAPAGEYGVRSLTGDDTTLRICNGRQGNTVLTNSASERGVGRSRLVFHKYGDQYFLAAVWGADNMGRRLRESKRERGLRKELTTARGHASEMEVVTIDAR